MKNDNNNIKWVETRADNFKDIFRFAVPKEWLHNILTEWAKENSKNVTNDKEKYLSEYVEYLYQSLDEEFDMGESIYQIASKENIIVDCEEIKVEDEDEDED